MNYTELLRDIKEQICQAQVRATLSANAQMLHLYWDIGRSIADRQNSEGWGAGIIPRLANDIRNDLSDVKGFSERNLKRMLTFYKKYNMLSIMPQAVA